MHVKRVYRRTVQEALAAAREELGPGALVLSTEMVPARGWRGLLGQRIVRLTAAAERPGAAPSEPAGAAAEMPAEPDEVSANRPVRPVSRPLPRLLDGAREGVVARLTATGLDVEFALAVADRMTPAECRGGADLALRRAMAAELAALCGDDTGFERYEVFVGPPGVGKTTTIAKIAAQERARQGSLLSLVAADAFRAGAVEQLRSYADVLGAPLRLARSADELERALAGSRRISLIDTAGRAPTDASMAELFDVLRQKRRVRTHLVMAADTPRATADRLLDRYDSLEPSRVIITKLDEAESVMPLIGAVRDRGIPVSYLTTGQRVPEDLCRATPASLAAALLHEPAPEELTCH